ncbi:MAG: hypothetical protein HQ555_07745 [Candidatus Aminicenantes bacterium]|nr:hypothetical protein [Candidatus Aminicenantes bacterium]
MKNKNLSNLDSDQPRRISIYMYPAQLNMIEEIIEKRQKTKRWVFMEAIQTYIGHYLAGDV